MWRWWVRHVPNVAWGSLLEVVLLRFHAWLLIMLTAQIECLASKNVTVPGCIIIIPYITFPLSCATGKSFGGADCSCRKNMCLFFCLVGWRPQRWRTWSLLYHPWPCVVPHSVPMLRRALPRRISALLWLIVKPNEQLKGFTTNFLSESRFSMWWPRNLQCVCVCERVKVLTQISCCKPSGLHYDDTIIMITKIFQEFERIECRICILEWNLNVCQVLN